MPERMELDSANLQHSSSNSVRLASEAPPRTSPSWKRKSFASGSG